MKIIKEGAPPSQRGWQMHCENCGCVFEATTQEFTYVEDRNDDYWKIKCPTEDCGDTLYRHSWDD